MNSQVESEALALLREICTRSPEVRLGQILAHLGFLGEDQTGYSLGDIEDRQLLAVLKMHLSELSNRQPEITLQITVDRVL